MGCKFQMATNSFDTKQLLHQASFSPKTFTQNSFTPNTSYTKQFLHQIPLNELCTKHNLLESPYIGSFSTKLVLIKSRINFFVKSGNFEGQHLDPCFSNVLTVELTACPPGTATIALLYLVILRC